MGGNRSCRIHPRADSISIPGCKVYENENILFFNSSIADLFSLLNSIHLLHGVI